MLAEISTQTGTKNGGHIVDPGTYVYTSDFEARNRFRSTAYHNTVMIDGEEQNRCYAHEPFNMNEDVRPVVLCWNVTDTKVVLVAEHYGYGRLPFPIVHRREVQLDKVARKLAIRDYIVGAGRHKIRTWVDFVVWDGCAYFSFRSETKG